MAIGRNLAVGCGCVVENKLFFSNRTFNSLFEFDLETEKLSFIDFFKGEELNKIRLHNKCIQNGRTLIFIPDFGETIHIFDLDTRKQQLIKIPFKVDKQRAFADAILYNNELWLFPFLTKQKFFKVDLCLFQLSEISSFYLLCYEKGVRFHEITSYNVVQEEELAYLAVNGTNMIMCWNMEKGTVEVFRVSINNLLGMYKFDKNIFLICENDNSIYLWEKNGIIKEIYSNSSPITSRPYRFIFEKDQTVYGVPCNANRVVEINLLDNRYRELLYPEEIKRIIEKEKVKFISSCEYEEKELIFPCTYDYFLVLDDKNEYLSLKKWNFNCDRNVTPLRDVIEEKALKVIRNNNVVREDEQVTLDRFMEELKRK